MAELRKIYTINRGLGRYEVDTITKKEGFSRWIKGDQDRIYYTTPLTRRACCSVWIDCGTGTVWAKKKTTADEFETVTYHVYRVLQKVAGK